MSDDALMARALAVGLVALPPVPHAIERVVARLLPQLVRRALWQARGVGAARRAEARRRETSSVKMVAPRHLSGIDTSLGSRSLHVTDVLSDMSRLSRVEPEPSTGARGALRVILPS